MFPPLSAAFAVNVGISQKFVCSAGNTKERCEMTETFVYLSDEGQPVATEAVSPQPSQSPATDSQTEPGEQAKRASGFSAWCDQRSFVIR